MPTASPPACSEQVETWLKSRGVSFKPCRRIPLEKVKHKESRGNQARAEALIPDVVERYTAAVKAGAEFPPIVVYRSGSGYLIIDGNHRDEAHVRAGVESITAYEVAEDTPSDVIEVLTVEANTKHGQPTDTAHRVRQAMHLLATGHDMDDVTTATGVTASQIATAKRLARVDERARRLGIYAWEDIAPTSRGYMASISSDPVLAAAAEVVIDTKMGADDLKVFLKQVRDATSEGDALRIVGEVGDQRKARQGATKSAKARRLASPRQRVLTALGAVTALSPGDLPRLFHTDEERKEVAGRAAAAALVLMEVEEVLRDALGA